jgi:hypothetical protein
VKKGKKAIVVVFLLLAGLVVGYWIYTPGEPSYQGRSASVWLDDLGSAKRDKARAALKAMGTNAVPAIVRKLKESESPWRNKYRDSFHKFPHWLAKILPKPTKAEFGWFEGANAFKAIGPSVEPRLVKLLKGESPSVRSAAAFGLHELRLSGADIKDAISGLIGALNDQSPMVRFFSAEALGYAGPEAEPAIPALILLLNDPKSAVRIDDDIRPTASKALGEIGPKAKAALPALRNLLTNNDAYLRIVTAVAIWRIDGDVTNTLPVLIQGLTQVDEGSKGEVADGIGEMGPRAKAAVPALLHELNLPPSPDEFLNSNREFENQFITNALKKIDPEAAAKAGVK